MNRYISLQAPYMLSQLLSPLRSALFTYGWRAFSIRPMYDMHDDENPRIESCPPRKYCVLMYDIHSSPQKLHSTIFSSFIVLYAPCNHHPTE